MALLRSLCVFKKSGKKIIEFINKTNKPLEWTKGQLNTSASRRGKEKIRSGE